MRRLRSLFALLLCMCLGTNIIATGADAISIWEIQNSATPAPSASSGKNAITVPYTIGGQEVSYRGEKITVVYESKQINLQKTPAVKINGTVMVPLKETFASQGIKVSYKYYKKLKKITISKNDKFIVMHLNQPSITVNQNTSSLPQAPVSVTSKPVLNFVGKKIFTPYNWTLNNYAAIQKKRTGRTSLAEYKRLVNYKKDTSYGFQFLRLDKFRPVNEEKFLSTYDYYIKNACENKGHGPSYSVLYGKGKVMLAAAKKEGIDPMYFVSQTFLESAYGTSSLARGNRINRVALPSYARSGGKFITKKIPKSATVYNLYGIKAYDSDPKTGATSHAYYKGWTTVDKAIYGAAKFIRENYFEAKPSQNTIFKFRFNPSNLNHQYATDPWYSEKIAQRILLFSRCYSTKALYTYDYPKFR